MTVMIKAMMRARSFKPRRRYETTNSKMRGMVRVAINHPCKRSSTRRERPMAAPTAMPLVSAIKNATNTRCVVIQRWNSSVPRSYSRAMKRSVSMGPGRIAPST